MHLSGEDLECPTFERLLDKWKFPALVTCNRWIDIWYETGDICPKRATGKPYSEREILGGVLTKIALYRTVFPKATLAKCRAHLFNSDLTMDPYSSSQLHRTETYWD